MSKAFALAVFLLLAVAPAAAELILEKISWEFAAGSKSRLSGFSQVETLSASPPAIKGKLRARLTLKNRGPRPVEGILLRYSLTARLAPLDSSAEGMWAVPFSIEEKRVPRVGANKLVEVVLGPSPMMDLYLKKLRRSGLWPDQMKIQVMIEPHHPLAPAMQVLEKNLLIKS